MNDSKNNQLVKTSIHSDCILRVTLNNPSQHNVLSEEMMSAIQSVLDKSIDDKSIRFLKASQYEYDKWSAREFPNSDNARVFNLINELIR